jgi:3-deoxy-manno-octulosonate cytidylyltransferase (CMP-KDO synthetase)
MSCLSLGGSGNKRVALVSSPSTHIVGLLPARWGSTRFPGKPLHRLCGKPLIQHVWERCQSCRLLDRILIATDDERIAESARGFGADVVMTSPNHPTGTDRIAEAVAQLPLATHVINIQGDEPLIAPSLIDEIAQALISDPQLPMVTAANVLDDEAAFDDPNVVKVVLDLSGHALYFSRSPLPFPRNHVAGLQRLRHKGIYGYRRDFLEAFVAWPPSPLEMSESLEQLRALENGARIKVILTDDDSIGLDTPEQAALIESLLSLSSH